MDRKKITLRDKPLLNFVCDEETAKIIDLDQEENVFSFKLKDIEYFELRKSNYLNVTNILINLISLIFDLAPTSYKGKTYIVIKENDNITKIDVTGGNLSEIKQVIELVGKRIEKN